MRRTWRSVVVTFLTVTVLVVTPAVAAACRITNATLWSIPNMGPVGQAETIYVWFSCGSSCGAYYEIEPGKYVNTSHGEGGYVQACKDGARGSTEYYRENGHVKISGSGEGRVKFPPGQGSDPEFSSFLWNVYDSDNDLTSTVKHTNYSVDHQHGNPLAVPGATWCWMGSP